MRLAFAILLVTALLSLSGCQVLIGALLDSAKSKRGTSREAGISAKEQQYRKEKERHDEFLKSFNELQNKRPAELSEWERNINRAFPPRY